jgi:formate--tetrahydrofolate ligase
MQLDVSPAPGSILEIGESLELAPEELEPYGDYAVKVDPAAIERLHDVDDGRLVCVTAMTPTKAGEGKTTTAISLADGLARVGERPVLCLREPSLGPVFGIKGGGTGGGRAQIVPMEQINLHFTGDIHAIGAANNLLAAMLEAHLLHGTSSSSTHTRSPGGVVSTWTTAHCGRSSSGSADARTGHRARPDSTSPLHRR